MDMNPLLNSSPTPSYKNKLKATQTMNGTLRRHFPKSFFFFLTIRTKSHKPQLISRALKLRDG